MKKISNWLLLLVVLIGLYGGTFIEAQPPFLMMGSGPGGTPRALSVDADGNLEITANISGADGAIQDGADPGIEMTVFDFTNSNPAAVHIVGADGLAASIGGGTQYTEADTDATITGTALMLEGAANALVAAQGTAEFGLEVDVTRLPAAYFQSDDDNIAYAGSNLVVNALLYVDGGANWERWSGNGGGAGSIPLDDDDDSIAEGQEVGLVAALNYVKSGDVWVPGTAADATAGSAHFATGPQIMFSDGTNAARLAGLLAGADDVANTTDTAIVGNFPYIWDSGGGNWDRWTGLVTVGAGDADIGNVDLEIAGTAIAVNSGAASAQTLRSITATNSPDVTALEIIDDWDESDRAKVNPIVGQAGVAANMGVVGATVQRTVPARILAFKSLDLDETEEQVNANAGELCSVWVTNTADTTRWLKFYNATAASVTVGSTTPVLTIGVSGQTDTDISGSFSVNGGCFQFDTALTVAATTGLADADTGAPAANDVVVAIGYR